MRKGDDPPSRHTTQMDASSPKTIQIFVPSGEPSGVRVAEITTRIVQLIEVWKAEDGRTLHEVKRQAIEADSGMAGAAP